VHALRLAGADPRAVHMNELAAHPAVAKSAQILCLPGGFSFGDDIAAGRILANRLSQQLPDLLHELRDEGKLILGICNGFQVLIQTGLLVSENYGRLAKATLALNDSGKFEDRWVYLQVMNDKCVFLRGIQRMYLPVAHAEGKFVARDELILERLDQAGQLTLCYRRAPDCETNGKLPYPENPNGSQRNVAGVCDPTGRVFGLMPHPERFVTRTQHPRWTRENLPEVGDGMELFQNAVEFFA
jgi:phosphoribosylformylglycinamidine synthase